MFGFWLKFQPIRNTLTLLRRFLISGISSLSPVEDLEDLVVRSADFRGSDGCLHNCSRFMNPALFDSNSLYAWYAWNKFWKRDRHSLDFHIFSLPQLFSKNLCLASPYTLQRFTATASHTIPDRWGIYYFILTLKTLKLKLWNSYTFFL